MPARTIRGHLFQVLAFCIVPIGLFAAGLLYFHWQAQERERERSQIEAVRTLAAAVDNALDSSVQRLSILARLWSASGARGELIYQQIRQALEAHPDWELVVAFRADGKAVFRSDMPLGRPVPSMRLLEFWAPVLSGQQGALVSDVFSSPTRGVHIVSVGVPVVRDGKVTHILIAALNLRWFDGLLRRQQLAEGGVAGIFDRNFKFVSRTAEGDARRGSDGAQALIADMRMKPEGIAKYTSLDDVPVFTAWTPSRHGWWVASASPSAAVDSAFWTYLGIFAMLWGAVVLAGIAFAVHKGRHIAASLVSLEAGAERLARGEAPHALPASRVIEVQHALVALDQASRLLQDAMRERDRSLETEREAREAAEAANRAKDEFLAMLGHELRNPLAAISSAAALVGAERRTGEQLDFAAEVLERQTQHLKRLIDDLLDVGRVMTGKIFLERQRLDLAATARHVITTLETAGRLVERRVELDAAAAWIEGDATRVEQIITNLVANAATYTAPGGQIRVRVERRGAEALLEVSDDGRGIASESLPRLFELFYQADSSIDRASGGLGIGLTLVQRLVALHGGTVQAASEGKGKGATFTVRFPAIASEPAWQPPAAPAPPRVGLTLLLVEDNADERETLRMALELQGYDVIAAGEAGAALAAARRRRPAAALLDIGLPGMNGYELARVLRQELGPGALLIALTGYGGIVEERRALAAGFDRHLTKPVEPRELSRALAAAGADEAASRAA
ncbi:MAG TPA: ATP-binding protein [Burkholderiales bacterium]|nr:ATP-binding protein [Burkholderiales bacterium]